MQLAEIQTNKQISMTSLQIAELCDKRHDSVKRTIEILSKPTDKRRAVIARPHSVIVQNVANNRTYDIEVYVFSGEQGRLDSITIVAQLNPQFTAALVARWDELEKQAAKPQIALPQDYLSALKALVTSEEQKQALAIENQTLKPKAEQWQRFIDTDGLLPSRTIGKLLGFKSAQEFNKAIKEKRVAFKADDGTWQFYADFKDKEIGKMVAWEKGEYNKAGTQLKWHTRAVEYFANLFNRQVQGGI